MSFEKRASIRPIGVMEKKNIGALKIFESKEMCKTTAAWNTPSFVKNSAKNWKTTGIILYIEIMIHMKIKQWSINETLQDGLSVSICPVQFT